VVPALLAVATGRDRRTVLGRPGAETVSLVEHLLSALWGLMIHDAEIWIDGPEVPILDGSAAPFVEELLRAGLVERAPPSPGWEVCGNLSHRRGAEQLHLRPHAGLRIDCAISYAAPAIADQFVRFVAPGGDPDHYVSRVAPARTFGLVEEALALRRRGLACGASLGSVLVLGPTGVLNAGGTRLVDEPVRHKLLDAMGDLSLLGGPLRGWITLRRCSHRHLIEGLKLALERGIVRPLDRRGTDHGDAGASVVASDRAARGPDGP